MLHDDHTPTCAATEPAEDYACDDWGDNQCSKCHRYFCTAHIGENSDGELACLHCDPVVPC